jgi:hypothetical protein
MGKCGFCEEFKRQRDREHKELRYEYSAVLERSVYDDGHFLFIGKCSSYPLRFCPECGKRLDGQEKPCGDCPAVFTIKAMAAADLQPVVRCKDCKHAGKGPSVFTPGHINCGLRMRPAPVRPDDFCSYGVRRRTDD